MVLVLLVAIVFGRGVRIARPGNGRIDVYHMGVCAEDPPFLSQINVFG